MVPSSWRKGCLGDEIELISGQHVDAHLTNTVSQGEPYLTGPADFPNNHIVVTKYTTHGTKFSQKGDILIVVKGSGTGKIIRSNNDYAISRQLMAARATKIAKEFAYHCLDTNGKRYENAAAGLIPGISRDDILNTQILIPPLPEQRKIAKILQTWDRAIATTEKLIDASKQQKKVLMQQLLTGKKRFVGFEGKWEVVLLGDICKISGGKRLPKGSTLQSTPNKHPYLRVTNMKMGGIDSTGLLYVPEDIAPTINRYRVHSNDLFITVAGTLGLVGRIPTGLDGANLTENADMLTNIKCDRGYLLYAMMSPQFQKQIENATTQNAQPKLALSRIRNFELPLPCDNEQQKIASAIEVSIKEIEIQEYKLTHLKQEKKALMQQLLTGKRRVKIDD